MLCGNPIASYVAHGDCGMAHALSDFSNCIHKSLLLLDGFFYCIHKFLLILDGPPIYVKIWSQKIGYVNVGQLLFFQILEAMDTR